MSLNTEAKRRHELEVGIAWSLEAADAAAKHVPGTGVEFFVHTEKEVPVEVSKSFLEVDGFEEEDVFVDQVDEGGWVVRVQKLSSERLSL